METGLVWGTIGIRTCMMVFDSLYNYAFNKVPQTDLHIMLVFFKAAVVCFVGGCGS